MSTLNYIKTALEENPNVVVVHTAERHYTGLGFNHGVEYWVAPKERGVYTEEELQKFMLGLFPPESKPLHYDFWWSDPSRTFLGFGKLTFVDVVPKEELPEGTTKEQHRLIEVRPFPSKRFAEDVLHGRFKDNVFTGQYSITPRHLKMYKFWERVGQTLKI